MRSALARRLPAGTCVAIWMIAMRMIEAITIYLAAGAPFGVSYYLRREQGGGHASAVLRGSWAALLWPVAAASVVLARARKSAESADEETALRARHEEQIERAKRQLLAMLYRIEELARALLGESQRSERVACVVRESVEKYVGLTLGAREVAADATPAGREMELCRIAGRTGDDLLLAGRCVHRRNVARLIAHRERARTDLLHALAEVRELTHEASANGNITAARHASVAVLRFYAQAINLLSLLEDEDAARKVARLLDAECARLRRLEAASPACSQEEHPAGEEQCIPHTHRLAFTGPSPTSPLTRG